MKQLLNYCRGLVKTQSGFTVRTGSNGIGAGNYNRQYRFNQTDNIERRFVIIPVNPGRLMVMNKIFVFHIRIIFEGLTW